MTIIIQPKRFVSLHAHSVFSIGDAIGSPKDNIDFALENQLDGFAFSEHGNMNSYASAYIYSKELEKQGRKFKLLPAIEFYLNPDLNNWRIEYEKQKEEKAANKKTKKTEIEDDESTGSIENEAETKQAKFFNDPVKRRHHLVVLAKNTDGLEGLFTLVSRSFKEGFYRFPRIDYKMLKEHAKGNLVATSACIGGNLAHCVLSELGSEETWEQDYEGKREIILSKLENTCDQIIDALGAQENFYPELQFNSLWQQTVVNKAILELCQKTGLKPVITTDSHYCRPEWWLDREIYRKLCRLNYEKFDPSQLPKSVDETKAELYPKNASQLWETYLKCKRGYDFYDDQIIADAIERAYDIAHNQIGKPDPDCSVKLPSFVVPAGKTAFQALLELCKKGMKIRGLDAKPEYLERLKYELSVIKEKDFARYFLTMKKIVDIAKKHMLVSHGRGSSASSLICYILEITNVDPIKYDLLFERFLSRTRSSMPDIDFDCADRDLLVQTLKKEFGEENVICITNYSTFHLKSLIKDLSRFYSIPYEEVNTVLKISEKEAREATKRKGSDTSGWKLTYEAAKEHSQTFKNFIEKYPDIIKHLEILLEQNRNLGKHAGGVLISENIQTKMPLIMVKGEQQTPWAEGQNAQTLSPLGFTKFDLLSIATLKIFERTIELILEDQGVINPTFEQVKEWYEINMSPQVLDMDDQNVYENVYHSSNPPCGVFQLSNPSCHSFFQKSKPKNIIDISTLTSIFRPGPLSADVDTLYVKNQSPENQHPIVKDILSSTRGFIIFQEQVLKLGELLANVPLENMEKLRKAISKKTGTDNPELIKFEKLFIEGSVKNGMKAEDAVELFNKMKEFSNYAFNKCLHKETLVETKEQGYIPIRQVLIGQHVNSINGFVKVNDVIPQGKKQLFKIKTTSGNELICTIDHKIQTDKGMKTLKEIIENNLNIVCKETALKEANQIFWIK